MPGKWSLKSGWDVPKNTVGQTPKKPTFEDIVKDAQETIGPLPTNGTEQALAQAAKDVKNQVFDTTLFTSKWASHHGKKKTPVPAESPRIKLLKVGADVEMFLRNKTTGKPVPVVGLIGGTKDHPMPVLREGFALQEDNVALEYNIPAASDVNAFVYSLMRIREEINERLSKLGLEPAIEASMRFEAKQLLSEQACTFGCDPDFNVWEQCENEKPSASPESATLRTAGGHVHLSFTVNGAVPKYPENLAESEALVMALDIFLGVPFTLIDTDIQRRKMYGKAGAFRPKPYGLEYRVLSPVWTRSPELMAYTYNSVLRAIRHVNAVASPKAELELYRDAVYKAINDGETRYADYILSEFSIEMPNAARAKG